MLIKDKRQGGAITGQVTTVNDVPIAGAAAIITGDSPSHADIAAVTNKQGLFRFEDLAEGKYSVLVNVEGYPPITKTVYVTLGAVAKLDFSLTK